MNAADVAGRGEKILGAVESAILGKHHVARLALAVLLSGGHLLLEDIPGVGKTTLAKAFAHALGLSFKRIQFTPDLLPTEITGSSVYNQKTGDFETRTGPIFANVVLADEINRSTPKTQAALLECMEERQVTIDGTTHSLPGPFFVVATQNNIETNGTYALPEAELDRFTARVRLGYPELAAEVALLAQDRSTAPVDRITSVSDAAEINSMAGMVRSVYAHDTLCRYLMAIIEATRKSESLRLGASPRASIALLNVSRAWAALSGRDFLKPDDIKALAPHVLCHRLILRTDSRAQGQTAERIVEDILNRTPVPAAPRG